MALSADDHTAELQIAFDRSHPAHSLPLIEPGERVLDVGCGAAQALMAACPYRSAGDGGLCTGCARTDCPTWGYGIDTDDNALQIGRQWTRRMVLQQGAAEVLPYADGEFDLVMSRVALPYTDISRSVAEIRRVLRPGGRVWLTVHPFSIVRAMARRANLKGLVFLAYVTLNGLLFHLTLRTFSSLGRRESWQTASAMRRLLERQGFVRIATSHLRGCLIVTARLPGATI